MSNSETPAWPNDLVHAIGLLFITASSSEQTLTYELARLICHPEKIDPALFIALQRADLSIRMRQIQTIAPLRLEPPHLNKAIRLCDKIKDAFERRNEFAHFAAVPLPTGRVSLSTFKLVGSRVLEPKIYNVKQILSFSVNITTPVIELAATLTAAGIRPRAQPEPPKTPAPNS